MITLNTYLKKQAARGNVELPMRILAPLPEGIKFAITERSGHQSDFLARPEGQIEMLSGPMLTVEMDDPRNAPSERIQGDSD